MVMSRNVLEPFKFGSPMRFIRSTANFLRFVAIVQMLTLGIVFVPEGWLAEWHAWLGLGPMPDAAFLRYVVRGASYCQAAIGLLLWVMATDVVRYRPLVITTGAIYLVGGPAFYFIDAVAGLPRWWCLMDGVSCLLIGGVLLALCLWPSPNASQTTQPAIK